MFVGTGDASHQQLRVFSLDALEKLGCPAAAERRRTPAVVQDDDLVAGDEMLESVRCWHTGILAQIQPGSQLWISQNSYGTLIPVHTG